jgi:hypothetical protein
LVVCSAGRGAVGVDGLSRPSFGHSPFIVV